MFIMHDVSTTTVKWLIIGSMHIQCDCNVSGYLVCFFTECELPRGLREQGGQAKSDRLREQFSLLLSKAENFPRDSGCSVVLA